MDNIISFMTANFVARQLGYQMTEGWGQGDRATNDYFRPEESFAARFAAMLDEVKALAFVAVDLWLAHLNPEWATEGQVATARELLDANGLKVVSLAGWFGSTPELFERSCEIARALDCSILGGSTSMVGKDRVFVVDRLQAYGLKLGLENHPEKNPAELLAKVGDGGDGTIGVTVDTGWFGTQGYDAADALYELREHLLHVHLKDVLAEGEHETCAYGEGIVPVRRCVQVLREIGYDGAISVEHEPEQEEPTGAVRASYRMLRQWMES
ncbi:MAG: sugar phosphate isomerase/epimerase [Anaerolineae bacterium]|nr:sugar phosphate isomerase/epimerase [Anaerolineae bacterium]